MTRSIRLHASTAVVVVPMSAGMVGTRMTIITSTAATASAHREPPAVRIPPTSLAQTPASLSAALCVGPVVFPAGGVTLAALLHLVVDAGSPARRSRQDVRRTADPAKVYVEDKLGASNRSPSSNRSNASPVNTILAREKSDELELKKKPPSVVARLMGLEDDLPGPELALHSAKRNLKKGHLNENLAEPNRPLQPREQYYSSNTTRDMHRGSKEIVEFKDVYEVSEEPLRRYHLQDQMFSRGMSSRAKSDIRMEIVRQKFAEAKRLATNDKLLNSKEFQEAVEVLSSNKDLFLQFLEEPNSNFSKQLAGLHRMPTQPQTKRITVLKPNKSVESEGKREIRAQRVNDENEHIMSRAHRRSHSEEVTFSQPTRIVVLKPSPGKPSRTMAQLMPRAAPSQDIVSYEVPSSSDCPTGDLDGLRSSGGLKDIRDEPSPTSVLDASFEDSNTNESESSRSITCSNGRVVLPSTVELITRSLSWEDMSSPSPGSTKLAPPSNEDDDELECVSFVQKILSSAGLDDLQLGMVFSRWYLPDCPLDPGLRDKLLDRKEEAAKSRERRSNQKLLFDCVNMALIEIGEDALLCICHWSQERSTAWRETLSQVLGEVPRHMRDWLYGSGKFVLNENDDAGTILERIVQQEVEGRGWMKSMRWELDEIITQIACEVLEELVEAAVDDLAICCLQQDTLMAISNL
ncbi:hypothetical protein PR202_ga19747 [Eleusine coracana subsp. coracana]|uniref:Uncharacterized protein n=1 Tax=Eleusine coracana subsp. coracana TaxID=191504 RepID=A0AAV5CW90_ELECO|nr:hypothetical protein PR202_ga19747 [Eleusine coracana subsp. coracana]